MMHCAIIAVYRIAVLWYSPDRDPDPHVYGRTVKLLYASYSVPQFYGPLTYT